MLSRWILAPVVMAALLSSAPPSRPPVVVRGVCLGCKDTPFQLGDVHFISAREGWSTAYYWPPGNGSGFATLLHTTDGGRHWRRVPFVWQNGAESGPPFSFPDRLHGWVAWHDQFAHHFSHTTDGGRSWTYRPSSSISHVGFFDARSGYSVEAFYP